MIIPNETYVNQCCCPEIPRERKHVKESEPDNGVWMPIDGKTEMAHRYSGVRVALPDEGIRRRKMKEKFWNEMLQRAQDEIVTAVEPNNYCTEYNSNFYKDNFQPRKLELMEDDNVKLKYPLYGTGSSAITYYSETIEKRGKGCNILEKFRKSQFYTKPMEERMDDGWVL